MASSLRRSSKNISANKLRTAVRNPWRNRVSVFVFDPRSAHLAEPVHALASELLKLTRTRASFEIYLVGTRRMPKNVLSFPAPPTFPRPDIRGRFLGEVYVNPTYIRSHGEDLRFMLLHGFLHLLGYDHEKPRDWRAMEAKETELLSQLDARNHRFTH